LRCSRQIARAARPARIGSGIEKEMRQVTKSSPKNGSSHTIARVYPSSVQEITKAQAAPASRAGGEERAGDRVDRERPARQDRARDGRNQDAADAGLRPTHRAIVSRGSSSVTNAPIRQPARTFGSIVPNRPSRR
jgi:hypothetical protein